MLTNLGYNTGWGKEEAANEVKKIDGLNAGVEHAIGSERYNKSQIVKNPLFLELDTFRRIDCEHVLIPIRELNATAKSREERSNGHGGFGGYCFGARNFEEQKTANAKKLYQFIEYLTRKDIPFTLLNFPRMIHEPMYLHSELTYALFPDLSYDEFFKEHLKLANPGLIRF